MTDALVRVSMSVSEAGMRRAEIAGLRWDDLTDGRVRVRGKGGKVRVIPLHPDLADELAAERARRDASGFGSGYRYAGEGPGGPWVFPGPQGGPMLPDGLGKTTARALDGCGVHTLRHRFATRAYVGTRALLAVQQLLGHSKPETTTRYARASTAALTEAVAAAG
jgi:integrase